MATTAVTTDLEVFSEAPPAPPARPRVLLIGTALAAGSASMVIFALIGLYAKMRHDVLADGEVWMPEEGNVQLTPGSMAMVTLLLSLLTVAWIVQALRNDDRGHALMAFGVTLLLGAAYINGAAYGWQQLGLGVTSSPQALLIYTITGLHVAMVGIGLLFLAVMGFRAVGGQLTGRAAEGVSAAALYWFVTVGVYATVWYTITITK
ncbi:MAG: cytochrome c oxidase subunit 3 [Acidimicrobiales bacterium]|nr:cytochrome c oxidase subunit 3 [Acidimicrobiales bacterium]